jgi:hypothetical protein
MLQRLRNSYPRSPRGPQSCVRSQRFAWAVTRPSTPLAHVPFPLCMRPYDQRSLQRSFLPPPAALPRVRFARRHTLHVTQPRRLHTGRPATLPVSHTHQHRCHLRASHATPVTPAPFGISGSAAADTARCAHPPRGCVSRPPFPAATVDEGRGEGGGGECRAPNPTFLTGRRRPPSLVPPPPRTPTTPRASAGGATPPCPPHRHRA